MPYLLDWGKIKLIEQFEQLRYAAGEYYQNRKLQQAAEYFEKALEQAEKIGDVNLIGHCQSSLGNCLMQLGQLKQALAALAPIVKKDTKVNDPYILYQVLIRYVEIAQQIPLSLDKIEKVYNQAEEFLKDSGYSKWRHELLVFRSRLYMFRGMHPEALQIAQEAWISKRLGADSHYGQVADYHFDGLVSTSIALQDANMASEYLTQWELEDDVMPMNRIIRFSKCQSELAYLENRLDDSIRWGRQSMHFSEQTDYEETKIASYISLIRAYLKNQQIEQACDVILRFSKMRHSERRYLRYNLLLLLGDYHSLRGQLYSKNDQIEPDKALSAYRLAKKSANYIDNKLNCSVWNKEAEKRIEYLERQ